MKMLNRKKIILFIVEGINDKTSLALCLSQLLNDDEMICSDNFYAGYYNNKSSSELYDMRKYLDTDFKFHTEKMLLTDDFNHHTLE